MYERFNISGGGGELRSLDFFLFYPLMFSRNSILIVRHSIRAIFQDFLF